MVLFFIAISLSCLGLFYLERILVLKISFLSNVKPEFILSIPLVKLKVTCLTHRAATDN